MYKFIIKSITGAILYTSQISFDYVSDAQRSGRIFARSGEYALSDTVDVILSDSGESISEGTSLNNNQPISPTLNQFRL